MAENRPKGVTILPEWPFLLILLAAVLWFAYEMVWESKVPFFRDLGPYFYPRRFSLAQAFQAGELPLWDRHAAMGFPLLADFQSGAFYPPHLLFIVLPFFTAVRALFVLHYLVAALGGYLLLRYWSYPVYLSLVGAMIFTFGGVTVSLTNLLNHFQAAVWLPWLILAGEKTFRSGRWGDFLCFTGAALVQFLAGSPEFYIMSMGLLFLTAVKTKAEHGGSCSRFFLHIALANLLVAGLSMIQLLPTMELVLQSRRPNRLPYMEATQWSLHPLSLINLFFLDKEVDGQLFNGFRHFFSRDIPLFVSYYMGQLSLFGVCSWLCCNRRKEKTVLLTTLSLTLVLALGRHTPLYFYLFKYVPPFSAIRFPEKFFFLTYILVAYMGLRGLKVFLEEDSRSPRGPLVICGAILSLLSALYVMGRSQPGFFLALLRSSELGADLFRSLGESVPSFLVSLEKQILLLLALLTLLILYRLRKISANILRVLIVFLVFIDLTSAHRPYQFLIEPDFIKNKTHMPLAAPEAEPYRLFSSLPYLHPSVFTYKLRPFADVIAAQWFSLVPDVGSFYGFDYMQEIDALGRNSYDLFLSLAKTLPPEKFYPFLGALNVRYIVSFTPLPKGKLSLVREFPEYPLWLYQVEHGVPRTYIAHKVVVEHEPLKTLERLSSADFDPLAQVILEKPAAVFPQEKVFQARSRITHYANQTVTIHASLNDSGVLVLADSFYPGWKAYVNGKEEPILRANLFFRAVALPAGEHTVEFRYEPMSFKIGLAISITTIFVLIVTTVICVLRKRREKAAIPVS